MKIKKFDLEKNSEEEINEFIKTHYLVDNGKKFLPDSRTLVLVYTDEEDWKEPVMEKNTLLGKLEENIYTLQSIVTELTLKYRKTANQFWVKKNPNAEKVMVQDFNSLEDAKNELAINWDLYEQVKQEKFYFDKEGLHESEDIAPKLPEKKPESKE